jgi:hypothetical protein
MQILDQRLAKQDHEHSTTSWTNLAQEKKSLAEKKRIEKSKAAFNERNERELLMQRIDERIDQLKEQIDVKYNAIREIRKCVSELSLCERLGIDKSELTSGSLEIPSTSQGRIIGKNGKSHFSFDKLSRHIHMFCLQV